MVPFLHSPPPLTASNDYFLFAYHFEQQMVLSRLTLTIRTTMDL
jgi:hypothetical protein